MVNLKYVFSLSLLLLWLAACGTPPAQQAPVATGLDNLAQYADLFAGKRIGIVTNHTAYDSSGRYIVDRFLEIDGAQITALFGPEHGIRGQGEAGEKLNSETDPIRDVPIYSLYGENLKPTPEMLAQVDILVFDIQDIGARFYTYIYTMAYAMEAAAEQQIPFIVLDRPNPIGGEIVEGNLLEPAFATFVGLYPIPVRHGMTAGELATLFNQSGWLKGGVQADLSVLRLSNWQRAQWYNDTGLPFISPSPNMPDLASATVYPGTCLLEGTNLNEGRGTPIPFRVFGAPWLDDGSKLATHLNSLSLPGVHFRDTLYTPVAVSGASANPRFRDKICGGVYLQINNRNQYEAYRTGVAIVHAVHQLFGDSLQWRERHFDRLCGTDEIRKAIIRGETLEEVTSLTRRGVGGFTAARKSFLLY